MFSTEKRIAQIGRNVKRAIKKRGGLLTKYEAALVLRTWWRFDSRI